MTNTRTPGTTPQLYRVPDATRLLSLSRPVIYEQHLAAHSESARAGLDGHRDGLPL